MITSDSLKKIWNWENPVVKIQDIEEEQCWLLDNAEF